MAPYRRIAAITATACLLSAAPAAAVPSDTMITNGGFELADIPSSSYAIIANGGLAPWFHAPRAGTTSSGIELQDGGSGAFAAGAGDQFAELDSDGPSHVYQDVATTPDMRYRLAFLYSPRPDTIAAQNTFRVSATSAATMTIGPVPGGRRTMWEPAGFDFVADAGDTRIEFVDLGPEEAVGGVGAFIDEVSLVPVYDLCLRYDFAKAKKAGSTIPIKLQLCDATGANVSSPSRVLHATGLSKVDDSASANVEDSGQANPDDDFRYAADLAGYIFNLSTDGLATGTWRLAFTVDGGSVNYAVTFDVR